MRKLTNTAVPSVYCVSLLAMAAAAWFLLGVGKHATMAEPLGLVSVKGVQGGSLIHMEWGSIPAS